MTNMSYQGYQDGRQQGEAASYYNGPPNPQHVYDPNRHQGYVQPNNPPYGNQQRDERSQSNSPYQSGGAYPPPNAGPGADGERGLMGGLAGAAAGAYGGHKVGHGVIGAIGGAIAGHKLQDFAKDRKEKKEEEKLQQQQQYQPPQTHGTPPPGYSQGPPSHAPQHHQGGGGGHHAPARDRSMGSHAGNFSASSHDIHLEGDYDLRATCRRQDGGSQESTLNLNGVLRNEDGNFRWAKAGCGASAATVTVLQGDTLREIARRMNCSFEEIARRNNLANPDMIYPGQVLQVPGGGQPAGNFSSSARDIRLVDGGRVLEAELRNTRGDWHRSRINLDERIGNQNGRLTFV